MEELYEEEKTSSCTCCESLLDCVVFAISAWEKRVGTYHCAGDTKALEFLAVVCARLCAVIRYENDLFACAERQHNLPSSLWLWLWSGSFAYHSCAGVRGFRRCRGSSGHRTKGHLNDQFYLSHCRIYGDSWGSQRRGECRTRGMRGEATNRRSRRGRPREEDRVSQLILLGI